MIKNEEMLKMLNPLRHCNHEKIKNIIGALFDYYSGVPRAVAAQNHSLSKRTYDRIVSIFKKQNKEMYDHLFDAWHCLDHCPLELGMPFSIWTPQLLKSYILLAYKINVTDDFCRYMIQFFYDSYYDKSNFDFDKVFYPESPIVQSIKNAT